VPPRSAGWEPDPLWSELNNPPTTKPPHLLTLFIQAIRMLFDCFAVLLLLKISRPNPYPRKTHAFYRVDALVTRPPLHTNTASSAPYGHLISPPAAAGVRCLHSPHLHVSTKYEGRWTAVSWELYYIRANRLRDAGGWKGRRKRKNLLYRMAIRVKDRRNKKTHRKPTRNRSQSKIHIR
jgi:hypothetical protein